MGGCVVVVSHAGAVVQNRAVYAALAARGEDVALVVPSRWRTEYVPGGFEVPTGDVGRRVTRLRVAGAGRPQRHAYLASAAGTLRSLGARLLLVEEEPFSVAALQWSRAARRAGIPYGVQLAETLPRSLPWPVAGWRDRVLTGAALVLARSPGAADLARRWGARGEVAVIPHDVAPLDPRPVPSGPFTVAFVGRLVEDKGLEDLLAAVSFLEGAHLVVAGAGPLDAAVRRAGPGVEYLGPLAHERVGEVFARAHATCVPSRAGQRWEEQFGRVAVESLVRAVPVVACATGALPWVLATAGGGATVPERDPAALAAALAALRDDPARAAALGATGRAGALGAFSTDAVAGRLDALVAAVSPR